MATIRNLKFIHGIPGFYLVKSMHMWIKHFAEFKCSQVVQGFHDITLLVRSVVTVHIIPLYYIFYLYCFICFRFFRYFFDLAIAINAVFIATDVTEAEWFFLALFTVEIMLKFYVYGPRRFVGILWNMWVFD